MMGDSTFQADLSRQDLTELPESLFARTTLQILDVHSNKLSSLPSDIGMLLLLQWNRIIIPCEVTASSSVSNIYSQAQ